MLEDEPKQPKFVYGPSVYEKIIPKNHCLTKLDTCVDWKRVDTILSCTTAKYRSVSISFYRKEFDEAAEFNATGECKILQNERKQIESEFVEMKTFMD